MPPCFNALPDIFARHCRKIGNNREKHCNSKLARAFSSLTVVFICAGLLSNASDVFKCLSVFLVPFVYAAVFGMLTRFLEQFLESDEKHPGHPIALVQLFSLHIFSKHLAHTSTEAKERNAPEVGALSPVSLLVCKDNHPILPIFRCPPKNQATCHTPVS